MLTEREKEIVIMTSQGLTAKEIAREIGISYRTVESHIQSAKHKTDSKNSCELIYRSLSLGLITMLLACIVTLEIDMALGLSDFSGDLNRRTTRTRNVKTKTRDLELI